MNLEEIIQLAEHLAAEHHGNSIGGDPETAFKDYDVALIEDDFGNDFEGLIRFVDNEYQVFINIAHKNSRTIGRRRFTTAHELGHFNITEHRDAIRVGKCGHKSKANFQSDEKMEREADIFASHFLVPTNELKKSYRSPSWGAKEVLDVARNFKTSITCSALRCQSELHGNSTLILWGKNNVCWQRMNRDWWFRLPALTIRNSDQLARGSVTELLLNGALVPESGFLHDGTTRSAWFPRIAPWSYDNDILIEYAIPLGSYGVLTLLRPDSP